MYNYVYKEIIICKILLISHRYHVLVPHKYPAFLEDGAVVSPEKTDLRALADLVDCAIDPPVLLRADEQVPLIGSSAVAVIPPLVRGRLEVEPRARGPGDVLDGLEILPDQAVRLGREKPNVRLLVFGLCFFQLLLNLF